MFHRRFTLIAVLALTSLSGDTALSQSRTDPNGDPLPDGALARLGTLRWRHPDTVTFVAFAADNTVLTGSADGVLRLWDRDTGRELRRFTVTDTAPPPKKPVRPGAFGGGNIARRVVKTALTEDGKIIAGALANNEVQLWNVVTGAELRKIPPPPSGVDSLAFSPDGKTLAIRGGDRSVLIYKVGTAKEISQIKAIPMNVNNPGILFQGGGTTGEASGMVFSRDGKVLATAEVELKMQKFVSYLLFSDVKTGNEIRRIEAPDGISALAYSSDHKRFAYASANALHVCRVLDGSELHQMKTPGATGALAFSPDGKILAAKGRDQVVRLFDCEKGDKLRELGERAPGEGINGFAFLAGPTSNEMRDVTFSADGKVLAVAAGPTPRFWDVSNGKDLPIAAGHRGAVAAVHTTPDGKIIFTRGVDRTIRRWDAATGKELGQFSEPNAAIARAFAPDGRTIAFALLDGTIRLHDAEGNELHQFKGHQNGASALAFSADSKLLASRGANDRTVRLYDVAKGTELGQMVFEAAKQPGVTNFSGQGVPGQGLAFSPDGKTLAANANVQLSTLHLWDVASRKEFRQIPLPVSRTAAHLMFSPDGRLIACENADQTISLCEIASGKERALLGQPMTPKQPANPQGLVIVNGRGPIRQTRGAASLAFTPDGGLLVARGPENSVRVWDVDFAKEVGAFKGHGGAVQSVSIAGDGKSLVSGSADTTALAWDLTSIQREPKMPAATLQPKELEARWADLSSEDAGVANKSILVLASSSKESVAFLRERLKPTPPADAKKLAGWIADLDSNTFQTRSKALTELEKLGELAVPALRATLASNVPLETRRRIDPLIEKLTTGGLNAEQIRVVRAMQVLERIGSPEARTLFETLAQGAPGALTTREAQASLGNLAKKSSARSVN